MARKQEKHKRKEFDVNQHGRRYVALRVAYMGERFNGFALQPNVGDTIEEHLFAGLTKTKLIADKDSCSFSRCGRTDKGVSAFGQVISLYVRSNFREGPFVYPPLAPPADLSSPPASCPPPATAPSPAPHPQAGKPKASAPAPTQELDYVAMLNGVLPPEIRVVGWQDVPPEFDARFSCLYRTYKYFFLRGDLDMERMRAAAAKFVGVHDFSNFCKIDRATKVHSFKRRVISVEIGSLPQLPCASDPRFDVFEITLCSHAFLWHQIRCMMGILFRVGLGVEPVEVVDRLLDVARCSVKPQYEMAADLPLVLWECGFEELYLANNPDTHARLVQHIDEQLRRNLLRAAMLHAQSSALHAMYVRLPGVPTPPAPADAAPAPPVVSPSAGPLPPDRAVVEVPPPPPEAASSRPRPAGFGAPADVRLVRFQDWAGRQPSKLLEASMERALRFLPEPAGGAAKMKGTSEGEGGEGEEVDDEIAE